MRLALAALMAVGLFAADEKKPATPPVIEDKEKLSLKTIEAEIYRLRNEQANLKEQEAQLIAQYNKTIQPLAQRCKEAKFEMGPSLDCVKPKEEPAPAK